MRMWLLLHIMVLSLLSCERRSILEWRGQEAGGVLLEVIQHGPDSTDYSLLARGDTMSLLKEHQVILERWREENIFAPYVDPWAAPCSVRVQVRGFVSWEGVLTNCKALKGRVRVAGKLNLRQPNPMTRGWRRQLRLQTDLGMDLITTFDPVAVNSIPKAMGGTAGYYHGRTSRGMASYIRVDTSGVATLWILTPSGGYTAVVEGFVWNPLEKAPIFQQTRMVEFSYGKSLSYGSPKLQFGMNNSFVERFATYSLMVDFARVDRDTVVKVDTAHWAWDLPEWTLEERLNRADWVTITFPFLKDPWGEALRLTYDYYRTGGYAYADLVGKTYHMNFVCDSIVNLTVRNWSRWIGDDTWTLRRVEKFDRLGLMVEAGD